MRNARRSHGRAGSRGVTPQCIRDAKSAASCTTRPLRRRHVGDRDPAPDPIDVLRVGIVGAGAIAAEHLRVLVARPDVEVVGIVDRSAATARWAAQRWQVTDWFTDHRALLATDPDVVHVLTPPPTHAGIARDALEAGAHVIVEKPIVATRADLLE